MSLANSAWPELPERPLVLVPVGSLEQHGPHLPLDTDTVIATAVATAAAEQSDGPVLVAPSIGYGSSGEHQAFAGTVSIGTPALVATVIEMTRSFATWAGPLVFVNGHGGNVPALEQAVAQLRIEGHVVSWIACATEDVDLHAGRTETSLMLLLRPDSVRLDKAERGNTGSLAELLPTMMAQGVRAVSENGVLGDPAGASAEEGRAVLAAMTADVRTRISEVLDG